eukprot:15106771-Alexandrium_andersonii.AAC.1
MWGAVALLVTEPISNMIGDYLQDEYMYHPAHMQSHDPAAERPWLPQRFGQRSDPPTLMSFMSGDQAA